MRLSSLANLTSGTLQNAKAGVRRVLFSSFIAACGIGFICCALAFGIAATYLKLEVVFLPYEAAAIVAGGLLFIGVAIIACSLFCRTRPSVPTTPSSSSDATRLAQQLADQVTHDALEDVKSHPLATLLTAVAAGVIVGVMQQRK